MVFLSQFGNILEGLKTLVILLPFGIFDGHFVYFMEIWHILWSVVIFFMTLVFFNKKDLATLVNIRTGSS
jgi:hypothetical protein